MKKFVLILFLGIVIIACNKKTVPSKTVADSGTVNNSATTTNSIEKPYTVDTTAKATIVTGKALVVINGDGQILTPLEKLPAYEHLTPNYSQIARAFTPAQKANLNLRFKTIPPKVLYVPNIYTQHSLKGVYSIYKKKFWYWKKADGLFYLDEAYYK
jgi:hypothetical protein